MDPLLRDYLWLWVVLVVLLLSFIIVLIFVFLSRWISRQGNLTLGLDQTWPSSKFQTYQQSAVLQNVPDVERVSPAPLPRSQFRIKDGGVSSVPLDFSYENLCEEPDYEDPDEDPDKDPDYEDPNEDLNEDLDLDLERRKSVPEYLKLETGDYSSHQQGAQDSDYDDITAAEEDDEDYDDVG